MIVAIITARKGSKRLKNKNIELSKMHYMLRQ